MPTRAGSRQRCIVIAPSPACDPYAPASDAAAPREGYAAEGASTFSPNLPPGDAMVPTATIQPKMPTRSTPELSAVASSLAPPPTSCSRTRPIAIDGFEPPSNLAGPARPHERPRFVHRAGSRARLECREVAARGFHGTCRATSEEIESKFFPAR